MWLLPQPRLRPRVMSRPALNGLATIIAQAIAEIADRPRAATAEGLVQQIRVYLDGRMLSALF